MRVKKSKNENWMSFWRIQSQIFQYTQYVCDENNKYLEKIHYPNEPTYFFMKDKGNLTISWLMGYYYPSKQAAINRKMTELV